MEKPFSLHTEQDKLLGSSLQNSRKEFSLVDRQYQNCQQTQPVSSKHIGENLVAYHDGSAELAFQHLYGLDECLFSRLDSFWDCRYAKHRAEVADALFEYAVGDDTHLEIELVCLFQPIQYGRLKIFGAPAHESIVQIEYQRVVSALLESFKVDELDFLYKIVRAQNLKNDNTS